jgi:PhnB protein
MSKAKPIPEGHHSLTPYLAIKGADKAIEFYKKAFGAREMGRMPGPDGKVMHAELMFGNSYLMLSEACPEMGGNKDPMALGGSPVSVHFYVDNVDAVFNQAVAAGAKAKMPPADMFWGDRFCKITDPFGHDWSIATHVEDVPREEMGKRAAEAMAAMAQGKKM